VKLLAQRFGMSLPELEQTDEQRASAPERETLLKIHESAAAWFREQLASTAARASADRSPTAASSDTRDGARAWLRAAGRDALKQALLEQGFSQAPARRAGLVVQRTTAA
jgi:DNA primase